jgi:hypothetical protein
MGTPFTLVDAPMPAQTMGTKEQREAIGLMAYGSQNGPLWPVTGGLLGLSRNAGYCVIDEKAEARVLGLKLDNAAGYGLSSGPVPSLISPDGTRLLIVDGQKLGVMQLADGSRRWLDQQSLASAWLDDDRVAVADGESLVVIRTSDGSRVARGALSAEPYRVHLGARPDGVVVAALGEAPLTKHGKKTKERAFEVFQVSGDSIARVGRRAKAVFTILVPSAGDLYFVEVTTVDKWASCKKLELAAPS